MGKFSQNALLLIVAVAVSCLVAEIFLRVDGRYRNVASQKLAYSQAIWERPANHTEFHKHPDLDVQIEIRFDADGVRNHSPIATSEKRSIIGFFGDSFMENRRVDDRFAFTSILDAATAPSSRVVNYGVDGYGLDQAYLRYIKYEKHDIRHVIYVFCENDLRNLYETGLVELTPEGGIAIKRARTNPVHQALGRLHLTYLVLSGYYGISATLAPARRHARLEPLQRDGEVDAHRARFHDSTADKITSDFLSARPSDATTQLARKFVLLLDKWRREVEAAHRTFAVFVLPRLEDEAVAAKLFRQFDGNVIHSFESFEHLAFHNDYHWNEYGNVRAAEFIAANPRFSFHGEIKAPIDTYRLRSDIDAYYRQKARSRT